MNQMMRLSIAGSTVVCAALLSLSWSEQRGVSLSVESAQARVGRPLTPVSVAGVARRQNRRAAYGAGYYVGDPNNRGGLVGGGDQGVGGGFGRPAYGFTGATGTYRAGVGSYGWGWGGGPGYAGGAWGTQASYAGPVGEGGWSLVGGVMHCTPGTWVTGGHGGAFLCGGAGGPTHYAHGANLVGGADSGIRRP
jgi:hypothetical protein